MKTLSEMEAALVKHYRAADAAGKNMIRTMAKLAAGAQLAEDGVRQMTHEPASVRAVRRDAYREQAYGTRASGRPFRLIAGARSSGRTREFPRELVPGAGIEPARPFRDPGF